MHAHLLTGACRAILAPDQVDQIFPDPDKGRAIFLKGLCQFPSTGYRILALPHTSTYGMVIPTCGDQGGIDANSFASLGLLRGPGNKISSHPRFERFASLEYRTIPAM